MVEVQDLANWIFNDVYDFVRGAVRQSAALACLGSNIPRKVKRQVKIRMLEEQC